MGECWASVEDGAPAGNHDWLNICWINRFTAEKFDDMVSVGPRVVVSTAAFHDRVRGSVPGLGGWKETKMFLPHPRVKVSIVGSLRDREVAKARISNLMSGGQCHLNHLTILRRLSWPSLAYMCTKVAYSPILFIFLMIWPTPIADSFRLWFETQIFRPVWMFVVGVVHIHALYTVFQTGQMHGFGQFGMLSMVLCTIQNP